MPDTFLLASAYFPPAEYISLINQADEVKIEREENYIKQTFRNRCYIHSANGPLALTVPVLRGSFHKTPIKDIRIDYSKRWQQVHAGAIKASYTASPFYIHYYDELEMILMKRHIFLLDLNMSLLEVILKFMGISKSISYSDHFTPLNKITKDFRYSVSPKKKSEYRPSTGYIHVFGNEKGFFNGLSIIDLLFNTGPDANIYI